jgi:undecaprenyl-diphosphatase
VTLFDALLLGLVQGLTEFLPVSSSGHLVLVRELLGVDGTGLALEITVHAATLLSVLFVLRGDVLGLLRGLVDLGRGRSSEEGRLFLLVAAGSVPMAVVGTLFLGEIRSAFASAAAAGAGLIVTAAILAATRLHREGDAKVVLGVALAIGCAQALALFPGISRSGATIAAALLLGVAAPRAFTFSFLLSIPAITGATCMVLPEALGETAPPGLLGLCLLAGAAAFGSGVAALAVLRGLVARRRLAWFAPYCLVAGGFALFLGS